MHLLIDLIAFCLMDADCCFGFRSVPWTCLTMTPAVLWWVCWGWDKVRDVSFERWSEKKQIPTSSSDGCKGLLGCVRRRVWEKLKICIFGTDGATAAADAADVVFLLKVCLQCWAFFVCSYGCCSRKMWLVHATCQTLNFDRGAGYCEVNWLAVT